MRKILEMSFPTFASDDDQTVVSSPVMEDSADDDSLYDDADVKSCKFSDVKYLKVYVTLFVGVCMGVS